MHYPHMNTLKVIGNHDRCHFSTIILRLNHLPNWITVECSTWLLSKKIQMLKQGQNAVVQAVLDISQYDHILQLLHKLQWLPLGFWI